MRALIIEDSRLARRELAHLLEAFPNIELLGEAENAEQALQLIARLSPDLIFLDIQMPGMNGFELLEKLDTAPQVIFTTAYDQYAVKAFDYNALDYLQKPIQRDRLATAIGKLASTWPADTSDSKNKTTQPLASDSQVFVKDGDRCWFVKLIDIRLFEVEGSYTRIHFSDQKPMIPKSLNQLESRLDHSIFFRANRQQIVNLNAIRDIEPWFSGGLKLTLTDSQEIEVSRRQATRFKELTSL